MASAGEGGGKRHMRRRRYVGGLRRCQRTTSVRRALIGEGGRGIYGPRDGGASAGSVSAERGSSATSPCLSRIEAVHGAGGPPQQRCLELTRISARLRAQLLKGLSLSTRRAPFAVIRGHRLRGQALTSSSVIGGPQNVPGGHGIDTLHGGLVHVQMAGDLDKVAALLVDIPDLQADIVLIGAVSPRGRALPFHRLNGWPEAKHVLLGRIG